MLNWLCILVTCYSSETEYEPSMQQLMTRLTKGKFSYSANIETLVNMDLYNVCLYFRNPCSLKLIQQK